MEIQIVNSVSKLLPFEANEGINHESGSQTLFTDFTGVHAIYRIEGDNNIFEWDNFFDLIY